MFVDFHSHVLPGIDDGSKSPEESVKLLDMLAHQGVEIVVATPHYNPSRENVTQFDQRRREALEDLRRFANGDMPQILLGAEVAYYSGISGIEELDKLCIEGTRLLLLEMPMAKWSKYTIDELINLSSTRGIIPIIAHIERCIAMQGREVMDTLCQNEVLMQINASFIIRIVTRMKAIRFLSNRVVQIIGSDCHGVNLRPPRLDEAYKIVEKRLGTDFVHELVSFNKLLIGIQ